MSHRIKSETPIIIATAGIIIFIAKLILIEFYGNATPFWDQWDAEAAYLYKPWIEGELNWKYLLAPHNEHRILTTRLLALLLLSIKGYWDPIFQMQVNAIIHVLAIMVLLIYLNKDLRTEQKIIFTTFSTILVSIPFGWENTLAGFQSQFYILLLSAFIFMKAMAYYPTNSKGWFYGYLVGLFGVFTLASGAITLIAGGCLLTIRRYIFKEAQSVNLVSLGLVFGLGFLSIYMTPNIPHHALLKADSVHDLLRAAGEISAWPLKYGFGLLIVQIPLLVLVLRIFFSRKLVSAPSLVFLIGMAIWLFGQAFSIAYGRAASPLASRYLDIFIIGLILNFFAMIVFIENVKPSLKKSLKLIAVIWCSLIFLGFYLYSSRFIQELSFKMASGKEQEKNLRAYLCSGDPTYLQNKPYLDIPYPNPVRLQTLLDNPGIRKILPGNINSANAVNKIGPDGEPFCNTGSPNNSFSIKILKEIPASAEIASVAQILQTDWLGTDYKKSNFPGYKIIGSLQHSELETGKITLKLQRGDKVLYRSGPRNQGQKILLNAVGIKNYKTDLPMAAEWVLLEFSDPALPQEFIATFIDVGTHWGEWSAVALRNN